MILTAFTLFHVILSLVGIAAGLAMVYQMISGKSVKGAVPIFLWTTLATSVTGFMFPFHGFTPGYPVGALSVVLLGVAIYAWRTGRLDGIWGKAFVVTSVFALYLNCLVLVVQLFEKIPALKALAPTQTESPFQITQLIVLVLIVGLGIVAARRFRPA